ncbi:MAG: Single-stranded DNA-binding protein [uncultured Sulfurovum sp.]|uniref:Single-stranded DNA-binding protein n=1 Tax=uncultured Sulfurovum sp. TaxID=269237 RepID=A0A6S6UFJ2_9BACT|nr:MAG: Single-stranded DNA-binding protein [uncultured Sulfurovum sp.]
MYNKIILAGNLTRDIEIKYTQSGAAIGNTAIATTRKFKSQTGEQKEEVLFVDITFFGRTAEVANQYLRKGSKVLVDGRLKLDQWTAQDGSKRSKHSVTVENMTMLGGRDEAQSSGYNAAPANDTYSQPAPQQKAPSYGTPTQPAPQQNQASNIPEIDINEDEIPF